MPQERRSNLGTGVLVLGGLALLYLVSRQQAGGGSDLFGGGGIGGGTGVGSGGTSGGGPSADPGPIGPGLRVPPGGIPPGGLPSSTQSTPPPAHPTQLGTPIPFVTIGLGPVGTQKLPIVPVPLTGLNRTASATLTDWLSGAGLKSQLGSGQELQHTKPGPGLANSPLVQGLTGAGNFIGQGSIWLGQQASQYSQLVIGGGGSLFSQANQAVKAAPNESSVAHPAAGSGVSNIDAVEFLRARNRATQPPPPNRPYLRIV